MRQFITKGLITKQLAALAFVCSMATSSFAIGIGNFKINPEVGGSFGTTTTPSGWSAGAYGRLWLFGDGLTISPLFKYDFIFHEAALKNGIKPIESLQAGGLVGYRIFGFVPYIGASYSSQKNSAYADTTALNYGIMFDIPILPLSIGIDASWQNPRVIGTNTRVSQNQVAFTLGLIF